MKQTIVPAQVTTVEDKIAGNISFKQMLLLVTPVFLGGITFAFLPPLLHYAQYKVIFWASIAGLFGILALRIKGKLVIDWALVKGRYNLRPSYYIYDKNTMAMRPLTQVKKTQNVQKTIEATPATPSQLEPTTGNLQKLEDILAGRGASLEFITNGKGALRVSVKQEQI